MVSNSSSPALTPTLHLSLPPPPPPPPPSPRVQKTSTNTCKIQEKSQNAFKEFSVVAGGGGVERDWLGGVEEEQEQEYDWCRGVVGGGGGECGVVLCGDGGCGVVLCGMLWFVVIMVV
ncbi:hypothetical protein E2C01_022184 [Portunus trituberculatus]|uniref:Uncharacterized protein n=1 Tax=Portunus trituberculatus TaxID=210409 RepID=A0A5B7E5B6_PORTR|nr:hypothetical protein [Portunus trituberculatus]